jgi:hypothetical protein
VIANNTGISPYLKECKPMVRMNAYICKSKSLGVLLFESEDKDTKDRSMQPIYISLNGTKMANKLNSMMDHTWDGFYAGQIRLSRFPGLINGDRGVYNLTFTGSPAKKFRFTFLSQNKTAGMTLRIAYPSAVSRKIVKDKKVIEYNQWNETLHMYGPVT